MKSLRLLGNASSLALMPPAPNDGQWEVWCANDHRGYNKWLPRVIKKSEWTRWFNLHSRQHMELTYPRIVKWYKEQTKPIYFQKHQPDIPASRPFPFTEIQEAFNTRYFTSSVAWLLAFGIFEEFEKIELWGIEIAKRKPAYAWERPCFLYWVMKAKELGIQIWYPDGLDWDFSEAGNPEDYTGPLYGLETKPEL